MKVLFDFGNTRLKWGVRDGDNWVTDRVDNCDPKLLPEILDRGFAGHGIPEQAWISSVASKESTRVLREWIQQHWSLAPFIVHSSDQNYGITNKYKKPETLGSDRWAALVAVRHRFDSPACIIDCGTTITMDMLDDEDCYRGGVIFPGLSLLRSSLVNNTSRLELSADEATNCLANSTSAGILSGTAIGAAGAIERIVECQQKKLATKLSVYITGGDARNIVSSLDSKCTVIEDLVLLGLDVISELES